MKLTATLWFAVILLAGCSAVAGDPSAATNREQALCEQSRNPGVWVAAAGACLRGGGN